MTDTTRDPASIEKSARTVRTAALIVGAVFLLVGVLGFIPGITTEYDSLEFAGHESEAKLLGLFQVSVLHNIVHLLFGVAGVALSRSAKGAFSFLVAGGAIYLVLWVYGLSVGMNSDANFVPLNAADNWLHLGLGLGMIVLSLTGLPALKAARDATTPPDAPRR